MMKKSVWSITLVAAMALSLFTGCGGGGGSDASGGGAAEVSDGGKVLNIYVWNDEFQGKFNANYPEVEKLSNISPSPI